MTDEQGVFCDVARRRYAYATAIGVAGLSGATLAGVLWIDGLLPARGVGMLPVLAIAAVGVVAAVLSATTEGGEPARKPTPAPSGWAELKKTCELACPPITEGGEPGRTPRPDRADWLSLEEIGELAGRLAACCRFTREELTAVILLAQLRGVSAADLDDLLAEMIAAAELAGESLLFALDCRIEDPTG